QTLGNVSGNRTVDHHLDTEGRRIGAGNAERRQQVPLIFNRMTRPERARPGDAARVHPAPAGDLVSDSDRRAAQPRQQRAPRAAVKVDGQVVARALEAPGKLQVCGELDEGVPFRRDDDLVDARVALDDRRRRRLDEVGDVSLRKPVTQGANRRRREHDVADLAETDKEDSGGLETWRGGKLVTCARTVCGYQF